MKVFKFFSQFSDKVIEIINQKKSYAIKLKTKIIFYKKFKIFVKTKISTFGLKITGPNYGVVNRF